MLRDVAYALREITKKMAGIGCVMNTHACFEIFHFVQWWRGSKGSTSKGSTKATNISNQMSNRNINILPKSTTGSYTRIDKSIKLVHLEDEWNRHAQIIEDLHYIMVPEKAGHVSYRGKKIWELSITSRGRGAGLKMLLYFYDIDACHAERSERNGWRN
jgi:hypothetical protein